MCVVSLVENTCPLWCWWCTPAAMSCILWKDRFLLLLSTTNLRSGTNFCKLKPYNVHFPAAIPVECVRRRRARWRRSLLRITGGDIAYTAILVEMVLLFRLLFSLLLSVCLLPTTYILTRSSNLPSLEPAA